MVMAGLLSCKGHCKKHVFSDLPPQSSKLKACHRQALSSFGGNLQSPGPEPACEALSSRCLRDGHLKLENGVSIPSYLLGVGSGLPRPPHGSHHILNARGKRSCSNSTSAKCFSLWQGWGWGIGFPGLLHLPNLE